MSQSKRAQDTKPTKSDEGNFDGIRRKQNVIQSLPEKKAATKTTRERESNNNKVSKFNKKKNSTNRT
jgi:hypothetical protein